jgi:hypothetical protein
MQVMSNNQYKVEMAIEELANGKAQPEVEIVT